MFTGILIGLTCLWLKGAFDKQLHQEENATARKYRREFPEEYKRRWLARAVYGYPEGPEGEDERERESDQPDIRGAGPARAGWRNRVAGRG